MAETELGSINTQSTGTPGSVQPGQQKPSGNPPPAVDTGVSSMSEFEKKYPEVAETMKEQMVWDSIQKQNKSLERIKQERKESEQGG